MKFRRADVSADAALARALRTARYEVLPLHGVVDDVTAYVPRELPVTVTASPRRGLEATLDLTERLCAAGYVAVPHLAARQVIDAAHLAEIVGRLGRAGVRDVFVIAGDCAEPRGRFHDSIELLAALDDIDHPFVRIGVAGYPGGHPFLDDAELARALSTKAPRATYVVTQMSFDAAQLSGWVQRQRAAGLTLPIHLGITGVVDRLRLLRVATRIGVGDSARFLRKHGRPVTRLVLPRAYRPHRLVRELAPLFQGSSRLADGLHVYTFNSVRATEMWRRRTLARLHGGDLDHEADADNTGVL